MTYQNDEGDMVLSLDSFNHLMGRVVPPGTDLVSLWPAEDGSGIRVRCDSCTVSLGTARYLNQVIVMWREHIKTMESTE